MPRFLKIGNVRYLNLDAIAEVRLTGEHAVITLLGGNVKDVPLDMATELLTWCDAVAAETVQEICNPDAILR